MKIDRDKEQGMAVVVQMHRAALLNLLTKEERKTTRRVGSTDPETFEDKARELADNTGEFASPRARLIADALNAYRNAINEFWVYAQTIDISGYFTNTWRAKHRGYSWIAFEDLDCEALFKIRHFIGLFKPENGNLADYALRGVHQHLTEFAAKQGPIEVPRDDSRKTGPSTHRRSIDQIEHEMDESGYADDVLVDGIHRQGHGDVLSVDPYDLINARLDGEIDDDEI